MTQAEHAVERAATPAGVEVDTDIEDTTDGTESCQGDKIEVATLDERDERLGDAGTGGNIRLPPATPLAHSPESGSDTHVIHMANVTTGPASSLMPGFVDTSWAIPGEGRDRGPRRGMPSERRGPAAGPAKIGT